MVRIIAYTENLRLLIATNTVAPLIKATNMALDEVNRWLSSHKLQIADKKTDAIILKGLRSKKQIKFILQNQEITPQNHMKYLGVYISYPRLPGTSCTTDG